MTITITDEEFLEFKKLQRQKLGNTMRAKKYYYRHRNEKKFKERMKDASKKWKANNRTKVNGYQKAYRMRNYAKIKAYYKKYYHAHKKVSTP